MAGTGSGVWVCLVCGYVHHGPEPPDTCPVCGASREDFEEQTAAPAAARRAAPRFWRCLICGYETEGTGPTGACPVCGASADEFEAVEKAVASAGAVGERLPGRVVVLGGGIAGVSAAESVREAAPDAEVVLVSREACLPYYRLNLTRYLAGEVTAESLPIHTEDWYDARGIRLARGIEAEALDFEGRRVELGGGEAEPFDRLIIACGAHPFIPPIPGAALEGVLTLRTVDDADALLTEVRPGVRCVCIGGGILGLETAGALARRGVNTTILESYEWLLPRQLNREAAQVLHAFVTGRGLAVRYQAKTAEIAGEAGRAREVVLDDGARLPADVVVITTGVRANTALARKAGLEVNQGIVVDSHLQTSQPGIYAAGDVAEHRGVLYGLWEPARFQGTIAGLNAAGAVTEFGGMPRANTLKVLGLDLFSVGEFVPRDGGWQLVAQTIGGAYYGFMFHDNALSGAILAGDARLSAAALKAVKSRSDCAAVLRGRPTVDAVRSFLSQG